MEWRAMFRNAHLDAPFWGFLVLGVFLVTSLGCFGLAAAQRAPADVEILSTDHCPPPADL